MREGKGSKLVRCWVEMRERIRRGKAELGWERIFLEEGMKKNRKGRKKKRRGRNMLYGEFEDREKQRNER